MNSKRKIQPQTENVDLGDGGVKSEGSWSVSLSARLFESAISCWLLARHRDSGDITGIALIYRGMERGWSVNAHPESGADDHIWENHKQDFQMQNYDDKAARKSVKGFLQKINASHLAKKLDDAVSELWTENYRERPKVEA